MALSLRSLDKYYIGVGQSEIWLSYLNKRRYMRSDRKIELQRRTIARLDKENKELKDKVATLESEIELYKYASDSDFDGVKDLINTLAPLKVMLDKAIESANKSKEGFDNERRKCSELMKKYRNDMKDFEKGLSVVK